MARTEQQSNEKYGGRWFWRYASPAAFFPLAGRIEALCWVLAIVLSAIGLYLGFFVAPTDAQQPPYDLVFMDVQMPNANGLTATRQIREIPAHRQTPIIAMTANAMAQDQADCQAAGMTAFVGKPLDLNLLVQDAYRNKILLVRGATFSADKQTDAHIRFNVAFSQQPRLAEYLRERLQSLAGARAALARVSGGGVQVKS